MTSLRKVDINLIVVLDAVLAERNLTRAGELLQMNQPAVSAALSRLRKHFDDPLLVRAGRTFELTPRARELQPLVQEAMTEVHQILGLSPSFDPAVADRTFYIVGSDYLLGELTSPLLRVVEAEAPKVRIEFNPLPWAGQIEPADLLRQDVTIAGIGRGIPGKRLSLFSDQFVCMMDASRARAKDGRLSLQDLRELRHVRSVFGNHRIGTPVDDILSAAGVIPDVAVTLPGFLPEPYALRDSELVGFVPGFVARRYGAALGLAVVETPIRPFTLIEAAHWHPSKTTDPALTWMLRMLRRASELIDTTDPV